jgi:hypothetical protein
MAETPLPPDAGVPLRLLRRTGLMSGIEGAIDPAAHNRVDYLSALYYALDPARRERLETLVRSDGRVPIQSLLLLWKEMDEERKRKRATGEMSSLRDSTESGLA